MGKSFKLRILIHLFVGMSVIIFANRQLAQYFLSNQLTERLRLDLAQGLHQCGQELAERERYLQCFDQIEAKSLTSVVANEHRHCPPVLSRQEASGPCQVLREDLAAWKPTDPAWGLPIDIAEVVVDGQHWHAVRRTGQALGDVLMFRQADVEYFLDQIWALRDRNLVYVLPFILLALTLVTLYVAFVALQPLRQLEKHMLTLDSSNLQGSDEPQPRFIEFRRFLSIFQELRARLNDSLGRARRFAGDASHELRTPLTILRGHCEQLIRRLPVGSDTQVQARVIGDEVERLITIVEKLLLLSRADANSIRPQMQALNLSETLEQMISDSDSAPSGLQVRAQIAPNIVWLCDRSLVIQMLHNLYANAINYNRPGGWVGIELTRQGDALSLTVTNPTAKVSDELLERAFERFYRADAAHGRTVDGHGLGLSLCLEIAKVHGASLSVERRPDEVFAIKLVAPLAPAAA
ncbi:MAG: ATP-binding protein [Betaproteobacteria bacterium]